MDPLINGKSYDWSSIDFHMTDMNNVQIQEVDYGDEQGLDPVYGKGGKIRGYGTGNQKNTFKITLLREDYDEMCRVIKSSGCKHFYGYMIPKATVSYADEGAKTSTDVITRIVFNKRDFKGAQGDTSLKVTIEGMAIGGISTNGLEA